MKISEFCKQCKISKSSIFKYLNGYDLNNITKRNLKKLNISKDMFDDYDKQYQKWYIQYYGKKYFYDISKKSHISIPSWTKYYMNWKLNKQIAKKIEKYIKENNIKLDNIDKGYELVDDIPNENEKIYKGNNYKIYSWNIDNNKRRMQIEVKNKPIQKNKKSLLKLLQQFDHHLFASVMSLNRVGFIIDINPEIENKIVDVIDKNYL